MITPVVDYSRIPAAALLAAVGSTVMNLVVWAVGNVPGRMTIGWPEVLIMSVLGAVAGALVFAALGRWSRRPLRTFAILTLVVLLVYAFGPVGAVFAPYMEGAERFNMGTLIATEIMHLVSGAWVYLSLARRAVSTHGASAQPRVA